MLSLCNNWEFTPEWSEAFARGEGQAAVVRIPHTVKEIPVHYADHNSYQMICGYRKRLELKPELAGKKLFLQFDGAAHIATVYLDSTTASTGLAILPSGWRSPMMWHWTAKICWQ